MNGTARQLKANVLPAMEQFVRLGRVVLFKTVAFNRPPTPWFLHLLRSAPPPIIELEIHFRSRDVHSHSGAVRFILHNIGAIQHLYVRHCPGAPTLQWMRHVNYLALESDAGISTKQHETLDVLFATPNAHVVLLERWRLIYETGDTHHTTSNFVRRLAERFRRDGGQTFVEQLLLYEDLSFFCERDADWASFLGPPRHQAVSVDWVKYGHFPYGEHPYNRLTGSRFNIYEVERGRCTLSILRDVTPEKRYGRAVVCKRGRVEPFV